MALCMDPLWLGSDNLWQACGKAARHGQLESLQWFRANDYEWNEDTCDEAAHGGHLHVLQWLRANGCDC